VRKLRDFAGARSAAEREPFNPLPDIHRLEEVRKQIGATTDEVAKAMLQNEATKLRLKLVQNGAVEMLGGAVKGVSTTASDIATAQKALDEAPDGYAAQMAAQKLTTLRLKAAYSGEAFKAAEPSATVFSRQPDSVAHCRQCGGEGKRYFPGEANKRTCDQCDGSGVAPLVAKGTTDPAAFLASLTPAQAAELREKWWGSSPPASAVKQAGTTRISVAELDKRIAAGVKRGVSGTVNRR
jgi:hypothetical protein